MNLKISMLTHRRMRSLALASVLIGVVLCNSAIYAADDDGSFNSDVSAMQAKIRALYNEKAPTTGQVVRPVESAAVPVMPNYVPPVVVPPDTSGMSDKIRELYNDKALTTKINVPQVMHSVMPQTPDAITPPTVSQDVATMPDKVKALYNEKPAITPATNFVPSASVVQEHPAIVDTTTVTTPSVVHLQAVGDIKARTAQLYSEGRKQPTVSTAPPIRTPEPEVSADQKTTDHPAVVAGAAVVAPAVAAASSGVIAGTSVATTTGTAVVQPVASVITSTPAIVAASTASVATIPAATVTGASVAATSVVNPVVPVAPTPPVSQQSAVVTPAAQLVPEVHIADDNATVTANKPQTLPIKKAEEKIEQNAPYNKTQETKSVEATQVETKLAEIKPTDSKLSDANVAKNDVAQVLTDPRNGKPVVKVVLQKQSPTSEVMNTDEVIFLKSLTNSDGIVTLNVADATSLPDVQQTVHIDEAVAFALKNNFEVLASREKTNGAFWDKMGGYAEYVPSVEYSFATGTEHSYPASYNDTNGDRVLDDLHRRHDRSVVVRQPLIDLTIISDILAGHTREDIAKSDDRDVREGVASDTVSSYLKLVQARIAIQLADQYRHYLDDLSVRMGARVEGGGGTSADLDRIKGRTHLAEAARVEAIGDYETNMSEFKRLTKIVPAQIKIPDILAPEVPDSIETALDVAVKANPTYLSSLSKIDSAADDRNKAISTLLPKLSMQYSSQYSYDAGGSAKGNPVDGVYPQQTTNSLMLVAQWALNSGTPITTALSSQAKEREMRYKANDVLARMEQGVRSGYTAANAAREREEILRKAVAADERVVKAFDEQYKNGGRSLFDLLDAYEQLYNARLNLMRVIIAKAQALYQLRKQMGELVPSIMASTQKE